MIVGPSLPAQPFQNTALSAPSAPVGDDAELMKAARALEASFLAQMLKYSGLGKTPEGFGGGVGEDQFSSLMAQIRAEQMVEVGGIGLAERLFEDLKARADG